MLRETRDGERRVALAPDNMGKLVKAGWTVAVQSGAGEAAGFADQAYKDAGAEVLNNNDGLSAAQVVVSVQPPTPEIIQQLSAKAATISFVFAAENQTIVRESQRCEITSFAMELVPRTSRAQSMDALSSQSLVAGYRSAIVAAEALPRFFPLLMTAAGTVAPAKVVVLGAGVAGLQAIATARRLGAVVSAYDVRSAAAEEIRSLGARSIDLDLETLEGAGGYAREMSEDRAERQRQLLAPHIADADVLITTAAVPGRKAPVLVTDSMVAGMRAGSVVVDIAAESGGNVEGVLAGETRVIHGVHLIGAKNIASDMPGTASRLYGSNITELLLLMTRDGAFSIDMDDDIVSGSCVTHQGAVVNEQVRTIIERQLT